MVIKYMKIILRILLFPFTWPFLLHKLLAKLIKSRLIHWFLGMLLCGPIFGFTMLLAFLVVFFTGVLQGTITEHTDMSKFSFPPALLTFGELVLSYFTAVSLFGPWLPGANTYHKERNRPTTFGDARFSTLQELTQAGYVGSPGIVFGRYNGKLVEKPNFFNGKPMEGHGLVVGGPGTGKTSAHAIPSLLRFRGGALVVDIKGELSELTARHRGKSGRVYIFDPFNGGHAYDPLRECKTVDGAQALARTLIPLPPKGEPFWAQSAQGIFAAAVLEAAHSGETFCAVAERICMTPAEQLIAELQESPVKGTRLLSSVGLDMPEKTLGGVMAELKSKLLTLASDEQIAEATSRSDFTAESLEDGATIYLRIPEHLIQQYKELWAVIINQFISHLTKRPDKVAEPEIMMLLDEMPRLGEIPILTDALATLRSKRVSILMLVQSMAQLDMLYGPDRRKVIADNCKFKFVLSASDPETQKYFADLAGQQTVHSKGMTVGAGLVPNMSRNETGVHLVRPEAWARLQKPILMILGMQPAELDLAFWFKDKELKSYALPQDAEVG